MRGIYFRACCLYDCVVHENLWTKQSAHWDGADGVTFDRSLIRLSFDQIQYLGVLKYVC